MHRPCEGRTDSAAAAGLAKLQIHSIALLYLDSNIALAPFVLCPRPLLTVQHYVGTEPIHQNGGIQALVQIIQRCLRVVTTAQPMLIGDWLLGM